MSDPRVIPTRTKARKRALDILFEADLRGLDPAVTLADRIALGEPPVRPLTISLVEGVREHLGEVDALVASALRDGWSLGRMPRVDRALARIATFELLYSDTEPQVAVAEAVTLAGQLSTDESPAFLNGVLGTILARVLAAREAAGVAAAGEPADADAEVTDAEATDADAADADAADADAADADAADADAADADATDADAAEAAASSPGTR